ncbi:helix-turn-helix transcriptional regulator [Streptomyces katrae]|uniref:helix-turn-helix transcriptional regulator n=1 Tax=Streptomyces katrae TaxID=68223 RepID=UPI0004C029CD|nr:WYL domain-containing protein [Streptomyces katrae]
MVNAAHARQLGIIQMLRSRGHVPARDMAERFGVDIRTIQRDITTLAGHGIQIDSLPGAKGGYRFAGEDPVHPATLDSDQALRLYVMGLLDTDAGDGERLQAAGISQNVREVMRRINQRFHFDTADWYWTGQGSGHLPVLRTAVLTDTALQIVFRTKDGRQESAILKPLGMVWKGGEWHMVAAPPNAEPQRYRLNLIDRIHPTDLTFPYPEGFSVSSWWATAMEEFGKGDTRVELAVTPAARDELLRLSLKQNSEVAHHEDGGATLVLYVDRWEWLIPLIASYGPDVTAIGPPELRTALAAHLRAALAAYQEIPAADTTVPTQVGPADDSRLRATHGQSPRSPSP